MVDVPETEVEKFKDRLKAIVGKAEESNSEKVEVEDGKDKD